MEIQAQHTDGRIFVPELRDGRLYMPKFWQNKIIIPEGYVGIITPEGEFGIIHVNGVPYPIFQHPHAEISDSCKQAAVLRWHGHEPHEAWAREVKSNVLDVKTGAIVAHTTAGDDLDFDAVRAHVGKKPERSADVSRFGMEFGTVNPVSPALRKLKNLVDIGLFDPSVGLMRSTNAGVRGRAFKADVRDIFAPEQFEESLVISKLAKCHDCMGLRKLKSVKNVFCDKCLRREERAIPIVQAMGVKY